ncbi:MAG: hypothetical protein JO189_18035 [Deltaproteobacteria bacterium]|nr:hypothetical protein [Deltaproteobacteria bacterium]
MTSLVSLIAGCHSRAWLARKAALGWRRPERQPKNSHTKTLDGVDPERSRRVQGGRKRLFRSFLPIRVWVGRFLARIL